MNTPTDAGAGPQISAARVNPSVTPTGWIDALLMLLSSRLQIAQLESKRATKRLVKRAAFLVGAMVCAFFGYALIVVGAISFIIAKTDWSWGAVTLGAALLHIIAAAILIKLAKSTPGDAFTHTRAEFHKDCEWLKNFQKNKKSKI